jgi:hypothetical protein
MRWFFVGRQVWYHVDVVLAIPLLMSDCPSSALGGDFIWRTVLEKCDMSELVGEGDGDGDGGGDGGNLNSMAMMQILSYKRTTPT